METKKQQELGRMYALRAGLSIISQKCDTFEESSALRNEQRYGLDTKFEFTNEEQVERNYQNKIQAMKIAEKEARQNLIDAEAEFKVAKKKKNSILGIAIALICTFIFFWGGIIILMLTGPDRNEFSKKAMKYNECQQNIKKVEEHNKRLLVEAEQERDENYRKLADYKKAKENFDELMIISNNQQEALRKESEMLETALVAEYRNLLDARDWENLDLVIYYYETGRADSVKEALQLVDVERRNKELVNSIQYASSEICRTMKNSVNALGEVLVAGFNSLSAQLEAQRIQTMGALQQINDNISGILTQQTLNNALLTKANVSSKDMVEQMKKLNRKIKSA